MGFPLPILSLVALACTPTPGNWPSKYARAVCSQYRDCDEEAYDYYYESRSACIDENELVLEDWIGSMDCAFDAEEAATCLDATRSASCDEWHQGTGDLDACGRIYDCGG